MGDYSSTSSHGIWPLPKITCEYRCLEKTSWAHLMLLRSTLGNFITLQSKNYRQTNKSSTSWAENLKFLGKRLTSLNKPNPYCAVATRRKLPSNHSDEPFKNHDHERFSFKDVQLKHICTSLEEMYCKPVSSTTLLNQIGYKEVNFLLIMVDVRWK